MVFKNENTWFKAVKEGWVEEFHRRYEEAVEKVKAELGKKYPMYIGGEPVYSGLGEFPDTSPADTRVVLGYFQKASREDVRRAVEEAKKAFKSWSKTPRRERVRVFRRIADNLADKKFEIAAVMSLENGKNRFEAVADVDEAIDLIRYYCEEMEANNGYDFETEQAYPNEKSRSVMKPYGVWAVISPFNFPVAIAVGMATGAMLTGNTAVFKPASDTPWCGLKFYEAAAEAGLPPGVLNYVTGPGEEVGRELVENPDVAGVVFTGSKDVGTKSYVRFASIAPRPFIAEMGGKNPVVVTAKADLDKAAEGVMKAAFGYGGQKCSACSRVYVDRRVKERFLEKLLEKVRGIKVGDPTKREVYLGPLINKKAYENFKKYVEAAKKDGRILYGGGVLEEGDYRYGYFVEPTVVDELPKDHWLFKEELFVPILCVAEVESLDEAIRLANNVEYGLTAGIFSEDKEEVKRFFEEIEAGVVYANRRMSATTGAMVSAQPFVGWKLSGSTGKGAGGKYYLPQFMREQSLTVCTE